MNTLGRFAMYGTIVLCVALVFSSMIASAAEKNATSRTLIANAHVLDGQHARLLESIKIRVPGCERSLTRNAVPVFRHVCSHDTKESYGPQVGSPLAVQIPPNWTAGSRCGLAIPPFTS